MTEEELTEMEKGYRNSPGREDFDAPRLIAEIRRLRGFITCAHANLDTQNKACSMKPPQERIQAVFEGDEDGPEN